MVFFIVQNTLIVVVKICHTYFMLILLLFCFFDIVCATESPDLMDARASTMNRRTRSTSFFSKLCCFSSQSKSCEEQKVFAMNSIHLHENKGFCDLPVVTEQTWDDVYLQWYMYSADFEEIARENRSQGSCEAGVSWDLEEGQGTTDSLSLNVVEGKNMMTKRSEAAVSPWEPAVESGVKKRSSVIGLFDRGPICPRH